ncbi:S1/P1 nuclease [Taibaiella lutea]|uniref:S1/P1 nuclease n=1 Tax=Taibaiella lutea TaxID=2608001 RepID=A0A5M6CCQ3_9BACT|nr:S1/P1 nuclease [Taibaiella lutea]KAA5532230.1 S1/P1 nuclease [Taibaiella lutea]
MKKIILPSILILLSIIIGSWGTLGHQTVAKIAENHLSPKARQEVAVLLGKQTLANVSNWADEIRPLPEYKYAAPLHYINVPSGLDYNEFSKAVTSQQTDNIYTAILQCKKKLLDKTTTREQKAEALKFLVHFVGDAHQPMHVSRAEDKGGNTIQVQFDGKGTNLHALWDSKLIDHQAFDLENMVKQYDRASNKEIAGWQRDEILKWLFESYQICDTLYAEVAKDNKLTEDYYKAHIPIVEKRIDQGGIRLAGLLNEIFKDGISEGAIHSLAIPLERKGN